MITRTDYIKSEWFVQTDGHGCFKRAKWAYFLTYPLWMMLKNKKNFIIYDKGRLTQSITSELWWAYSKWHGQMSWAYIQRMR